MKRIDQMRDQGKLDFFSKKERGSIEKEYGKLNDYLEGIREMKEAPACLFVVDIHKEHIAVAEARRLGIPVVGLADTNSNPEEIEYPIPANDDAIRSISLFSNLVADSYLEGAKEYEHKLRSQTDKKSDEVVETKKKEADAAPATDAAGGPAVVKVTKTRKLVAAGLADQVEIEQELEAGDNLETPKAEAETEEETSN